MCEASEESLFLWSRIVKKFVVVFFDFIVKENEVCIKWLTYAQTQKYLKILLKKDKCLVFNLCKAIKPVTLGSALFLTYVKLSNLSLYATAGESITDLTTFI